MTETTEQMAAKALELIAERDAAKEWTFSERLTIVSLARSALDMLLQQQDRATPPPPPEPRVSKPPATESRGI